MTSYARVDSPHPETEYRRAISALNNLSAATSASMTTSRSYGGGVGFSEQPPPSIPLSDDDDDDDYGGNWGIDSVPSLVSTDPESEEVSKTCALLRNSSSSVLCIV